MPVKQRAVQSDNGADVSPQEARVLLGYPIRGHHPAHAMAEEIEHNIGLNLDDSFDKFIEL